MTRATILLFKHAFDPILRHRLPGIVALVAELSLADKKSALEYLYKAFRYLSSATPNLTAADLKEMLEDAFDDGGATMTDFVAEWIEQGKKEGLAKGMEISILRVLVQRFNQVPAGIEARLTRMTVQMLELALARLMSCSRPRRVST